MDPLEYKPQAVTTAEPETASVFVVPQAKPQMVLYANPAATQASAEAASATIKWSESVETGVFASRFRFIRSGMVVATIAVAFKVALDLAQILDRANDGNVDLSMALGALPGLLIYSWLGLAILSQAYGQFSVKSDDEGLVIERKSLFGIRTERTFIKHESCFGIGLRHQRSVWCAVLIDWDGEVSSTPILSGKFEQVSFVVARLNQVLTERRTRLHYR